MAGRSCTMATPVGFRSASFTVATSPRRMGVPSLLAPSTTSSSEDGVFGAMVVRTR